MDLHDTIYWFGFGVLVLLGCGGLLCLAYVSDPDDIHEAYTNYFLDASAFVACMRDAILRHEN